MTGVNWEQLAADDPYSTEPVTKAEELVGRQEIMNKLLAATRPDRMGSCYVFGQKRVGKTSVVKALRSTLETRFPLEYLVVFLEGGDFVRPTGVRTVQGLGQRLAEEIMSSDRRFANLPAPKFEDALAPLGDLLNAIRHLAPNFRILFILDEFDELPIELYKRGELGDAFFLTLRSISGKESFAFVLVGGEKMDFIISCQGDTLNKFQSIRIDYFHKETNWKDFCDLVLRPVTGSLEFSDDALVALYDEAAGNPFFNKLICRNIYQIMVDRRDCHVTASEVEEGVRLFLDQPGSANQFQHFWEDGIFESGARAEQVSMTRRKVLLAMAEAWRESCVARVEAVAKKAQSYDLSEAAVTHELRDFVRRKVLEEDGGVYRCTVRLFERWLKENGFREMIMTITDVSEAIALKKEDESEFVQPREIIDLIKSWGIYRGRAVGEGRVRDWLKQFGPNRNQRLMFRVLKGLRFYSGDRMRAKLREAHGIVMRGLTRRIVPGKMKRNDILVSYLDGVGKSGAQLAKMYSDENNIYVKNVVERSRISQSLKDGGQFQAIVFVDDFMGSGHSATEAFKSLVKEQPDIFRAPDVRIVFVVICGFGEAVVCVEKRLAEMGLSSVQVHVCDRLDEGDRCFSEKSRFFTDLNEREQAKRIARSIGERLEKKAPLGYGECQSAVIFEDSSPNNNIAVLWSTQTGWNPLFPRY